MDRRKFLSTLNAIGLSGVLPGNGLAGQDPTINAFEVPNFQLGSPEIDGTPEFPKIGLIAIGGVSRSILGDLHHQLPRLFRTIAVNTDANSLQETKADRRLGVGCIDGGNCDPQAARPLSRAHSKEIDRAIAELDVAIVVAGMGGAAGTGIAPEVAKALRLNGTLTLGVAILPFQFEGEERHRVAAAGILALSEHVDALIPIRNSDFERFSSADDSFESVFHRAPCAALQLCNCVVDSLDQRDGLNYLVAADPLDMHHGVLVQRGHGAFGFGLASRDSGPGVVVQRAIAHPCLGIDRLHQARAVMVTIDAAGDDLKIPEARRIMNQIRRKLSSDADLFCSALSRDIAGGSQFTVSILATGIEV